MRLLEKALVVEVILLSLLTCRLSDMRDSIWTSIGFAIHSGPPQKHSHSCILVHTIRLSEAEGTSSFAYSSKPYTEESSFRIL